MNSTRLTYLGLGLALIILLGLGVRKCGDKKVDWRESFSADASRPYGAESLRGLLDDLFPQGEISDVKQEVFDQLVFRYYEGTNYLFINDGVPMDSLNYAELRDYIKGGNHVFMAARKFPQEMREDLIFETAPFRDPLDTVQVQFTEAFSGSKRSYEFPTKRMEYFRLQEAQFDHDTLSSMHKAGKVYPNFIRFQMGQGTLLLCSSPRMFTNLYMVHPENYQYIEDALSYLPKEQQVFWDEHYKIDRLRFRPNQQNRPRNRNQAEKKSILDRLLESPALAWAFWIGLIGFLLFYLFEAKRKQRLIPIVNPLPNTTLDFTETIGRLYFQSKNHQNIAQKRIKYFLAHIRSTYNLKTVEINEEFLNRLSGKSGMPFKEVKLLFFTIERVGRQSAVTENELIDLNQKIDHFYEQTTR
ncbi:MAG: hypothetical protein AAFR61_23575 [Bacteroidota bacterium]